ncbi:hypothetical protein RSOLAG22IIIB_09100 [Rhizoctonia solani]|uniref:Uncharacterized protein n=1 Tax=Rhizoctonia solani TaxID=456999 RepID=A0A0K6FWX5_9AGAM|nr:hypothetical protein RSOLAG22IIIB_09100 [Rhizoctonia solani]
MALPASTECHPTWGREYPQYTNSYTTEALSTLLISAQDSRSLTAALDTINTICQLGNSHPSPSMDHITLPMLTDLLDTIGDPGQLRFMAEPALISGCVSLMASVKPSVFQYEYGYVCFRILVISLNALIMKDAGCLEETIAHMNDGSAPQRLSTFWAASSWLIYQKSQGSQSIIPIKSLSEPILDQLLKLLYHDEKLFLTVSKRTRSLGLSGLMFALFAYLIATEKRYRSPDGHFKEIIRPYSRIFWRYLIVTPDSEAEEITIFDLHSRVTPYTRLYNEKPVDVEDSINLLQALNDRLGSPRPVSALIVPAMLRFVAPLVVPGCEDLIPTTIERCIGILWNSLSSGHDAAYARHSVLNFLLYMRDMLMALKPTQFNNQPWIWEVVDNVVAGDLLDLALRVFSTSSSFDPSDLQGENERSSSCWR